jgi:hypothetical protein
MSVGGGAMYVTTRHYSGLDRAALDEVARRREEIEAFVGSLPGLQSWYAFTSGDSMTTVTISDDQRSAEETVTQVAGWIRENMPTFSPNPPEVRMGEVIAQTSKVGQP